MAKIRKIKAAALQYVLVIAVVVTMLSSFFILSYELNSRVYANFETFINTENALKSLELLVEHKQIGLKEYGTVEVPSFAYPMQYSTQNWGLYSILSITVPLKIEQMHAHYFMGTSVEKQPTICIENNNRYLYVSGKTEIEGSCEIPTLGIKRTSLGSSNFIGNGIKNVAILESKRTIPALKSRYSTLYADLQQLVYSQKVHDYYYATQKKKLQVPFSDTALVLYSASAIDIENIELYGNIVVISNSKITVDNSASLNDIILCAPEIDFSRSFKGAVQSIADSAITIGNDCKLEYPSSACVIQGNGKSSGRIEIGDDSEIYGSVILNTPRSLRSVSEIFLGNNALLVGILYSTNRIQLRDAQIYGSLYAHKLFIQTAVGFYENQLHNMSMKKIPDELNYGSGILFESDSADVFISKL